MAQANGVDIIGGNCLGVADSWNRVRIGGALGGDHPDESLIKGSVAIFSNSGGFTTTIAQYLGDRRLGDDDARLVAARTSTSTTPARTSPMPSRPTTGRRRRCSMPSRAATTSTGIDWTKPVVACVVGRWKSKLTRAVGHAGAMAGSGDRAEDKERLVHGGVRGRLDLHARQPGRVEEGRGRHQHRRHPGGADRGDGAERRRARLRAARQPGAEAVGRQRPGAAAAGGDRPAAGHGARALRRADRDARPAGRRGGRAAEHEGQVGRVASWTRRPR